MLHLVAVMIVKAIIPHLATIGIPSFLRARKRSLAPPIKTIPLF